MNKFKIGDKVRLRDDLEEGEVYDGIKFLSGMKDLQGKELTIDYIDKDGDYTFEEDNYYCSEEMLEKVFSDGDLLEFALGKLLYMTKEELIERYKESKISEQDLEDMKKRSDDFKSYCDNNKFCIDCDVHKFQKRHGLDGLDTKNCMLVYEYLFKK